MVRHKSPVKTVVAQLLPYVTEAGRCPSRPSLRRRRRPVSGRNHGFTVRRRRQRKYCHAAIWLLMPVSLTSWRWRLSSHVLINSIFVGLYIRYCRNCRVPRLRTPVSQLAMASEPVAVLYLQLALLRISAGRTVMRLWTNSQFSFPHSY